LPHEFVIYLMKWFLRLLRWLATGLATGLLLLILGTLGFYAYFAPQLPAIEDLRDIHLQVPLRIFTEDGKLLAEYGEKRRIPLHYRDIPQRLVQAFLAAEDDRFFEHPGIDYQSLLRASWQLLLTGEKRQGGSTITMQVARNFFLTPEKTFSRKITEILLALKIEQELTKEEIFELYLNKIYLGNRAYGIGAAAQVYYGKKVEELDLAQTAMIAALPKAPSRFNPISDPARSKLRRDYVLGRMFKLGYINQADYQSAMAAPLSEYLHKTEIDLAAPYVAETIRAEMVSRYGAEAYTAGLRAYATIDAQFQLTAIQALRDNLDDYDMRHGYRGAEPGFDPARPPDAEAMDALLGERDVIGGLRPALVTALTDKNLTAYLGSGVKAIVEWKGLSWARPYINENRMGSAPKSAGKILKPGDAIYLKEEKGADGHFYWRLAQIPAVEGAFLAMNPQNGRILAMVGGYAFSQSKFNRAVQARRQPGSAFKPFIYSAALESGYTPASIVNDAPIVFDDPHLASAWRPENYGGDFLGPIRLRFALAKSRNLVSVRILKDMGLKPALEHIAHFGFDPASLPHNYTIALGTPDLTMLELARGYTLLANGGYLTEPYLLARVETDRDGTIFTAQTTSSCTDCPTRQERSPGISQQNWYQMYSMLQDVILYGTAEKARSLKRKDLAGKTGTTNDQRDAWFCGFNQHLLALSWVGFDSFQPLGKDETGGKTALPAWIRFMETALQGTADDPPIPPAGLVSVRIDPQSGLLAAPGQKDAIFEVFPEAKTPKERSSSISSGTTGEKPAGRTEHVDDLF